METQSEVRGSLKLLLLASALTFVLWFIPLASVITYPIQLLVTFIHETGHALVALATLGGVNSITLEWNGNGATLIRGGWSFLTSTAGYVTTTLYGSALLLFLRKARNARAAAATTGGLLLVMTVLFAGNLVAWLVGILFGVGCLSVGLKANRKVAHFLMSFLAVQCILNAFYDLRALLYLSAYDPGTLTDARIISESTGGFLPPIVWAVCWALLSVAVVAYTLLLYARSVRQAASLSGALSPSLITERSASASAPHI